MARAPQDSYTDEDQDYFFQPRTAEERAYIEANEAWYEDVDKQTRMLAQAAAATGMPVHMAMRADVKVSCGLERPDDRMPPAAFRAAHLAAVVAEMRRMKARQMAYQARRQKTLEAKARSEERRRLAAQKRKALNVTSCQKVKAKQANPTRKQPSRRS